MMRFNSTQNLVLSNRIVAVALAAGCTAYAGDSMARPGTPNQTSVRALEAHVIELNFVNTASEQVTFDFELTKLSSPAAHFDDPNAVPLDARKFFSCIGLSNPTSSFQCTQMIKWQAPIEQNGAHLAVYGNKFDANSRYCSRVRAREWHDGHPQEGNVSDKWSAWKCATTQAKDLLTQSHTSRQFPSK